MNTRNEFQSAYDQLVTEKEIDFTGVSEKMDSDVFNNTMSNIESNINSLYEDIRLLNDAIDYTRRYITESIEKKRLQFLDKLKIIEKLEDDYSNNESIAQIVPFTTNKEKIKNRLGYEIPAMNLNDGSLEMASTSLKKADIQTINQTSKHGAYINTSDNLINGEAARSEYITDEPIVGGISERYKVLFETPQKVNYIDIDTVNCDISKKDFSYINGNDEEIKIGFTSSFVPETEMKGIAFTAQASDYEDCYVSNLEDDNDKTLIVASIPSGQNQKDLATDMEKMSDIQKIAGKGIDRGKFVKWYSKKAEEEEDSEDYEQYSAMTKTGFSSDSITLPDGSVVDPISETGYRFVPSNEISKKKKQSEADVENTPEINAHPTKKKYKYSYKYSFGIDSIKAENRKISEESGFVSEEIFVGGCTGIELSVKQTGTNNVEYYIIDGLKTIPILPKDIKKISKERLLEGTDVRFMPNKNKDIVIYKDDVATNLSYEDISAIDFSDGAVYEISYTPLNEDVYRYEPKEQNIKIKIIQHKGISQTVINAVSIKKIGGTLSWNL